MTPRPSLCQEGVSLPVGQEACLSACLPAGRERQAHPASSEPGSALANHCLDTPVPLFIVITPPPSRRRTHSFNRGTCLYRAD